MTDKREKFSHIRDDGSAKEVFETREKAAVAANEVWFRTKRPYAPYICSQKPQHWHIGHGDPE